MILRTIRTAQMILRMGNIEQKTEAIRKKYIEFNQPCLVSYFVFDLDYSESALAWREENLPEPFGSHRTRKMGMCISVIAYCSLTQRQKSQASSQCSTLQKFRLQWLEKLKADAGYSRKLTKNPYNPAWRTMFFTDKSYLLDELADYIVVKALRKSEQEQGLGRNCTLFERGASWSYTEVMEFKRANAPFALWHNAVKDHLKDINGGFPESLPYSEIKATAKSIATWVWQRFSEQGLKQWHAEKGRKGGQKSKRGAKADSERSTEPWKKLEISRATYYRRQKKTRRKVRPNKLYQISPEWGLSRIFII